MINTLPKKTAKYLFVWFPNGYVTKAEYIQIVGKSKRYIIEKGLKTFIQRGYVEERKDVNLLPQLDSNIDAPTILYILTPKGLLFLKQMFSEEYPWLEYINNLYDETFFSTNSKFKLEEIEHNIISAYFETCGIDTYSQYKYANPNYTEERSNPFRAIIEKAQREWIRDYLKDQGIDPDKTSNGPLEQICKESKLNYEEDIYKKISLKYIRPNTEEPPDEITGHYVSRKDCSVSILATEFAEGKGLNVNNSGILITRLKPYIIYYYWAKPPYIVTNFLNRFNNLIWNAEDLTGYNRTKAFYGLPDMFVLGKNNLAFKYMIERAYITNKSSKFSQSYFNIVQHLYLTPTTQAHLPVMSILLLEPERMESFYSNTIADFKEYGFEIELGTGANIVRLRRNNGRELVFLGFDMNASTVYRLYSEYQDYDMKQIQSIIDQKVMNIQKGRVFPKEFEKDPLVKLYGSKRPDKEMFAKRIYAKPKDLSPNPRKCTILCFEYQKTFYEFLFKYWVNNGCIEILTYPNPE